MRPSEVFNTDGSQLSFCEIPLPKDICQLKSMKMSVKWNGQGSIHLMHMKRGTECGLQKTLFSAGAGGDTRMLGQDVIIDSSDDLIDAFLPDDVY